MQIYTRQDRGTHAHTHTQIHTLSRTHTLAQTHTHPAPSEDWGGGVDVRLFSTFSPDQLSTSQ